MPKYNYRLATDDDFNKNPEWKSLYEAQLKPQDAHQGELGVFVNPDGSISTERSTTVQLGDQWVNIPMLVKGQSPGAINRILYGTPTQKDYELAVQRFIQRTADGLSYTPYKTLQEAVSAAESRSSSKLKGK